MSLFNFCAARALRTQQLQQRGAPPPRREVDASPYSSFTAQQLAMRRKWEILKNQNKATSAQTQSSQYVRLVTRKARAIECAASLQAATPSTGSDVPGPTIPLQLDPTVPLYLYAPSNASLDT
jgi:hypothetical protein